MKGTVRMPSHSEWRAQRYKVFNEKIDSFKGHPRYESVRWYADKAMDANESWGYGAIVGEDFITRIEQAPLSYIADWFDGKNELTWDDIKRLNAEAGGKE